VKGQVLILLAGTRWEWLWSMRPRLLRRGFLVVGPSGLEEFDLAIESARPDFVLVDLSEDEQCWLDTIRKRQAISAVPLLAVLPNHPGINGARCLDEGADDCQTKPIGAEELIARIGRILARYQSSERDMGTVQVGDLVIDLQRRLVSKAGAPITLTRTEWFVLEQLVSRAGDVIPTSQLVSKVWGVESREHSELLRVVVCRLRRKLEAEPASPSMLTTHPGIGYSFHVLGTRSYNALGARG
jgi:two-component system KDP operon response regulator KdpE